MLRVQNDRLTKWKIATGYLLLLAILFISLMFIYSEMKSLAISDTEQDSKADSLLLLLHKKDKNTIAMLKALSDANNSLLSAKELDKIVSEQDSVINQQRVQHRIITKRDSLMTPAKKKGFFKRLVEAFVPPKDTALLVNTSLEFSTDTLLQEYNPADSLHNKIRRIRLEKQKTHKANKASNRLLRQVDSHLTLRIDSMIKDYEEEATLRIIQKAELGQKVRQRSMKTIAAIAVGAVLLSAVFLILIWRDITRSNRYRKELEKANRRTEGLLEAREKLMLTITHDFKAPLGSIMGYTDLLSRLVADERQKFYLDNMKSSSGHLLSLVNDLLDFHRLDLNKAEVNRITFNPAQLFDEIKASFQPLVETKGLALQYEVATELNGHFVSDPIRIRQIVNNLLSNAVKFTVKGSISLIVSYEKSMLKITVSDTGKGMAPEDKERIFQEFIRLPGAQGEEGFGLGLSIVRKLVDLLEGNITLDSTKDKGSSFVVTLPLYPVGGVNDEDRTTPDVVQLNQKKSLAGKPNLKILLIDDDKIQLALTAAMLGQYNIPVTCCEQLEELTEHLRNESFDFLLTDVQMPSINGFDLLKLLRASNIAQARTIPMIAVTARSEMSEAYFHDHGFVGCLHKPFSIQELLQVIDCGEAVVETASLSSAESRADATTPELNFASLLVFSADDKEAAHNIIESFITETTKNAVTMNAALQAKDVVMISSMAHKMLPLFTLLGASEAVSLLSWLEGKRDHVFSKEMEEKGLSALSLIHIAVEQAKLFNQQY
ncbi:ATP-binding protein [uncultured Bacteroides sp.]|uniref:ATP-binding response regulator n=1 Tax=uncultured Bacteroides sp. TaxID=162156 RepID=UPI002AA6E7CD|nr:ATP-binding protein [uncultured Bacteroides sp.]